ncbi:hypothetical protein J4P02_20030 [Pseudomonas sp. NFXW11]|uniref:hypothetical protein n=1 Tax=Pseudomonas sp. NFXW11 TaxID=2819531 RepID=UPI003CEA570B
MTVADPHEGLSEGSTRDLQLYAAACLEAYCAGKGIRHPAVADLIRHLKDYPQQGGLPAWDRAGALLALNGRGDDWPQDLVALISPDDIEAFSTLVESAVEVGIVDLYGGSTDGPLIFVRKITGMLRGNLIELPRLHVAATASAAFLPGQR